MPPKREWLVTWRTYVVPSICYYLSHSRSFGYARSYYGLVTLPYCGIFSIYPRGTRIFWPMMPTLYRYIYSCSSPIYRVFRTIDSMSFRITWEYGLFNGFTPYRQLYLHLITLGSEASTEMSSLEEFDIWCLCLGWFEYFDTTLY